MGFIVRIKYDMRRASSLQIFNMCAWKILIADVMIIISILIWQLLAWLSHN